MFSHSWAALAAELGPQPAAYIDGRSYVCDHCPKRGKNGTVKRRHPAVIVLPLAAGSERVKDKDGFGQTRQLQVCPKCYERWIVTPKGAANE